MMKHSSPDEGLQREGSLTISSAQGHLKASESASSCTAAGFAFSVEAARERKVPGGLDAEGSQGRHLMGALTGPSSPPAAADADTNQSQDELDHAVLDVNESSIVGGSSSSLDLSSVLSTSSHQSSTRTEDPPMDTSLDMSMIAHTQQSSLSYSSDQHDLSLDLSAINQYAGSLSDFQQLSAANNEKLHSAWSQQQLLVHHESTPEDDANPYAYENPVQFSGAMGDPDAWARPAAVGMLDTAPAMPNQHAGSSNGSNNPDGTHSSSNSSSSVSNGSPSPVIVDNAANGNCNDRQDVTDNTVGHQSDITTDLHEGNQGNALREGPDEAFMPFPVPLAAGTASDVAHHDGAADAGAREQHDAIKGQSEEQMMMATTTAEGPVILSSTQQLQVASPVREPPSPPRPATTPHSAAILSSPCRQDMEREPSEVIDVAEASLRSPGGCGGSSSGGSSSQPIQLEAGQQVISPLQDEDLWFFADAFGDVAGAETATTQSPAAARQQQQQQPTATGPSQVPSASTGCAIPNLMDMF